MRETIRHTNQFLYHYTATKRQSQDKKLRLLIPNAALFPSVTENVLGGF